MYIIGNTDLFIALSYMKPINIISILQAHHNLSKPLFQKLMNFYGIDPIKGIRDYELNCIRLLFKELTEINPSITYADGFYLGFSIPQIGKEFDLLRFGNNSIINIEVKVTCTADKILSQLIRNQYYLSFLNQEVHIYAYIYKENKLYKLTKNSNSYSIQEINISELNEILLHQDLITYENIDNLFNPVDYLISPFNSTEHFIDGKYFLTIQQEQIYREIQRILNDPKSNFTAITGNAGTGKTLLTYHIAKDYIQIGKKVLILHCAQLNNRHRKLIENWGWNIIMAKEPKIFSDYDLIIVDEAQRMYPIQFTKLVEAIQGSNTKCIFSFDEKQYLRENERKYNIKGKIETELKCTPFKLTNKIRTNTEISHFIKQLFNRYKNIPDEKYPNISLGYCSNPESAKTLINAMHKNGWKTPNYTPGTRTFFNYEKYRSEDWDSAHSVIGQEFEKVTIVLDESFRYDSSGELVTKDNYYSQKQMLYQIVTRAIKKLHILIINNESMMDRCIEILSS